MNASTFTPRGDDIYIASYPRSGTTWLQKIVWELSPMGRSDFGHISDVMPFFERALRAGDDLDRMPSPRLFKTHLQYRHVHGRPGRYIYIARDGRDVAVSYYHFHVAYVAWRASFDEFFERFVTGGVQYGSWFQHVAGWAAHGDDPNVLLVTYEQLQQELEPAMRAVARFCAWEIDDEVYARAAERCSFTAMRAIEHKLGPTGDHAGHPQSDHGSADPAGAFLRSGRAGEWQAMFSTEQARTFASLLEQNVPRALRERAGLTRYERAHQEESV